jgi:hypothetical protein
LACGFSELVIETLHPERIARWWAEVLDYRITELDEEQVEIAGPAGSGPTLVFVRVQNESRSRIVSTSTSARPIANRRPSFSVSES